jgi:hypothetical protein
MKTFTEFWPFYLNEHRKPATRWLHFTGSTVALLLLLGAILSARPWWILAAIVSGYAFAWISHFTIEKNRPATFKYPLWSLAADWKMWALMITGRLGAELKRLGISA